MAWVYRKEVTPCLRRLPTPWRTKKGRSPSSPLFTDYTISVFYLSFLTKFPCTLRSGQNSWRWLPLNAYILPLVRARHTMMCFELIANCSGQSLHRISSHSFGNDILVPITSSSDSTSSAEIMYSFTLLSSLHLNSNHNRLPLPNHHHASTFCVLRDIRSLCI